MASHSDLFRDESLLETKSLDNSALGEVVISPDQDLRIGGDVLPPFEEIEDEEDEVSLEAMHLNLPDLIQFPSPRLRGIVSTPP